MLRLLAVAALATGWHVVAQGQAGGGATVAKATGTAIRATALRVKVTASPNVRSVVRYSMQCRRGKVRKKSAGQAAGRTPLTKTIAPPLRRPDVCVVTASAPLGTATRLTVTILAR